MSTEAHSTPRTAEYWIDRLRLSRHPEGGYFRETYRSTETISPAALPHRYGGRRSISTAIYYLLTDGECSGLHRVKSDEVWHFYAGSPLTLHIINERGDYAQIALGASPDRGETLQATVKAGCWFGATVDPPQAYALAGCTVAPGFDFADFQLAHRQDLLQLYPEHRAIIERLTR
ncbi:MAG: cupin domain-containing protein [Kiritimatiellae bacterium]|nr:cupin domain-containing protein [Kiritimatiellia bacterium]